MPVARRRKPRARKSDTILEQATTNIEFKEPVTTEPLKPKQKASTEQIHTQLGLVRQLDKIRQEKKVLEAREAELKNQLREFVNEYGSRNDKGSSSIVIGDKLITNSKRINSKLNQDKAIETFKGLGLLKEVSEVKPVVLEELVEQLILQEKVPQDILDEIMDTKETFVFKMTDYKEIEEQDYGIE